MGRTDRSRTGGRAQRIPPGLHLQVAGQLVPGPGHRARQRGGHRRGQVRAWQLPGVPARAAPVVDAHHRLRPPSDRRSGHHRLAREGQADAAQLDRRIARRLRALHGRDPVRQARHGDLHHPSRYAVRHHIRRGLPGAPPAGLCAGCLAAGHPRILDRRLCHAEGGRGRLPPCRRDQDRQGPRGRGGREDRPVHRLVRHQPDHRRQATTSPSSTACR